MKVDRFTVVPRHDPKCGAMVQVRTADWERLRALAADSHGENINTFDGSLFCECSGCQVVALIALAEVSA